MARPECAFAGVPHPSRSEEWGLIAMTLLVLIAGTVALRARRTATAGA